MEKIFYEKSSLMNILSDMSLEQNDYQELQYIDQPISEITRDSTSPSSSLLEENSHSFSISSDDNNSSPTFKLDKKDFFCENNGPKIKSISPPLDNHLKEQNDQMFYSKGPVTPSKPVNVLSTDHSYHKAINSIIHEDLVDKFISGVSTLHQTEEKFAWMEGSPSKSSLLGNFDKIAGESRVILRNSNSGFSSFSVVSTHLRVIMDTQNGKIGVKLPKIVIPAEVIPISPSIEAGEIYICLGSKATSRVIKCIGVIHTFSDTSGIISIVIPEQYIAFKPFKDNSGIKGLLEGIDASYLELAAEWLMTVSFQNIFKTFGPNEDTMLMALCFSKEEESPALRAKILALTQNILGQTNPSHKSIITQNNCYEFTALDYAVFTNKPIIACFLTEIYLILGEDIMCRDSAGNSLLHLAARTGDDVSQTLKVLLALKFQDGNRVYSTNVINNKMELPVHLIASKQVLSCQSNTLQMLNDDMSDCFKSPSADGSLALHVACQHSHDPTLVALILYYNQDVVNVRRNDGFTALHILASRCENTKNLTDVSDDMPESKKGNFLDENTQLRMIRLLLEHGADARMTVTDPEGCEMSPSDILALKTDGRQAIKSILDERVSSFANSRIMPFTHSLNALSSDAFDVSECNQQRTQSQSIIYQPPPPPPPPRHQEEDEEEDVSIDVIAKILYNHPTIQAVMEKGNP